MRGWLAYIARSRSVEQQVGAYARLRQLFLDFAGREVLDFDAAAGACYQELTRSRLRVGAMDLKIAAIALAHDATLVSRNLRDYQRIPGLTVKDWTVEAAP